MNYIPKGMLPGKFGIITYDHAFYYTQQNKYFVKGKMPPNISRMVLWLIFGAMLNCGLILPGVIFGGMLALIHLQLHSPGLRITCFPAIRRLNK
jgi:hypothetical protein